MARFFAFGFLALPLIEIALFIVVGRAIGLLPTLALVVLAAFAGILLLRRQGLDVVNRLRSNMSAGTIPGRTMFDTMLIGLAGILLIIPGFFGDIVALLLLIPPVRHWLYRAMTRNIKVVQTTATYRSADPSEPQHLNRPQTIDLDDDDWQRK